MKRYLYILLTAILPFLSGCYDNGYLFKDSMVRELATLPVEVSENGLEMIFNGKSSGYSNNLYFEVSPSSDFPEGKTRSYKADCLSDGTVRTSVSNWFEPGTCYVRLYGQRGNDRIYADNVESFTFDNPLTTLDATDITTRSAVLHGVANKNAHNYAYFEIATNAAFEDSWTERAKEGDHTEDGDYNYEISVGKLSPGTVYYVRFCMGYDDIIVKGNTIEFATEKSEPLSIGYIGGTGIDGKQITDRVMIVLHKLTDGEEWIGPIYASYNADKKNYVFDEPVDVVLNPDAHYDVYAVTGNVRLDGNGIVTFSEEDYSFGKDQTPIYRGENKLYVLEPSIKIELTAWTGRLTVKFPMSWGKDVQSITLKDIYGKNILPGSSYYLSNKEGKGYTEYRGISANGVGQSDNKYTYTFNIFPFNVPNTGYVDIVINFGNHSVTVPCPEIYLRSGESKVIDINGLGIGDVSVSLWDETEGGSIIIKPNK